MKRKFSLLIFAFLLFATSIFAVSLTLITNPPQSLVYVNDVLVGQTNENGELTIKVEDGSKVKIENIGYSPYAFIFNGNTNTTVHVNLKPISYLYISCAQPDAQAIVDGNNYLLPATVTLAAGRHEVIVQKDGYVPQKVFVTTQPFGIIKKDFQLQKSGKISITTSPPHVFVVLDDEATLTTPISTYLKSGKHSLSFSFIGYAPFSTDVYVPENSTPLTFHFELNRLFKVTIDSSPSGAIVSMASTTFVAPATFELTKGIYKYIAHQKYTYEATGEFFVNHSGKYTVKLKPKKGLVVFNSNPIGAAINLNGKFIGQTQKSVSLPYGKYKVKMVGNNGKVWFENFVLNGEIKTIYGDMVNSGMVLIDAYPSTNTIVHIGQVWTSVPATLNADVGVYKVEFFNPSFPVLSRYIEVKAGEVSDVHVFLQPMSTLFISTYPLGATVTLDGKVIGKAPIFSKQVTAGTHLLNVKWSDGEIDKKILLLKDKVYSFTFNDPSSVKITFVSYPDPLNLVIDGNKKGSTPISIQLTRGEHSYIAYNAIGTQVASGTLDTTYFSSQTYFFLNGR
ncbi:PEGA domain-containing protein [Mesoaciditoga sp.]